MRPRSSLSLALALSLSAGLFPPAPLAAQNAETVQNPPVQEAEDSAAAEPRPGGITPGGAFLRSILLPGWGHAKVGAHVRGAFYVAVESAAAFMLFKTQTRLSRTRDRLELMEGIVTARLEAEGVTDPDAIESALVADPVVDDLRALEITRSDQREDWMAAGIFFLLLSGADAYVSAHLAEIPAALEVEGNPQGGMDVGISVPLTFR